MTPLDNLEDQRINQKLRKSRLEKLGKTNGPQKMDQEWKTEYNQMIQETTNGTGKMNQAMKRKENFFLLKEPRQARGGQRNRRRKKPIR